MCSRAVAAVCVLVFMCFVSLAEGSYSGGAGTAESPWQIGSAADLLYLAGRPGDYNKCFILTADIDLSGMVFMASVIGPDTTQSATYAGQAFTGSFDGGGFSISNLTIDTVGAAYSYLGLFGRLGPGARVQNLTLPDASITQTAWSKCVGTLAGDITEDCDIEKCEVVGGVITAPNKAGLLVGECAGTVRRCHVRGRVTGYSVCGGLIGNLVGDDLDPEDSRADGLVEQSSSAGQITGMTQVGGLVGSSRQYSKISECVSSVQVSGGANAQKIGGLVGEVIGGLVVGCRAIGDVAVGANAGKVGGLIGQSGPDLSYPGIVMMTYCRNTVTYGAGGSEIGGYAGNNLGSALYYNYYLAPSDWSLINGLGEPLTDGQMQTQASFVNWDFEDTWIMQTYPILAWEKRISLSEFSSLAQYWSMGGCYSGQPCAAADWYMDGAIDEKDLVQLAQSWLGLGMDVVYPTYRDGFETGDFTALPWVHSGNLPWQIVWSTDFEGLSAARSGPIGDSQSSELRLTVYTPGTYGLSFRIKGSTQYTAMDDKDSLMWYIDGNHFGDFYGEFDWTEVTGTLHEGVHTLRWVYSKNAAGSAGQDCVWIDNVHIEKLD